MTPASHFGVMFTASPPLLPDKNCAKPQARPVKELAKELRHELIAHTLTENPELSNREIGRRLAVNYETVGRVRKLMPQG